MHVAPARVVIVQKQVLLDEHRAENEQGEAQQQERPTDPRHAARSTFS